MDTGDGVDDGEELVIESPIVQVDIVAKQVMCMWRGELLCFSMVHGATYCGDGPLDAPQVGRGGAGRVGHRAAGQGHQGGDGQEDQVIQHDEQDEEVRWAHLSMQ